MEALFVILFVVSIMLYILDVEFIITGSRNQPCPVDAIVFLILIFCWQFLPFQIKETTEIKSFTNPTQENIYPFHNKYVVLSPQTEMIVEVINKDKISSLFYDRKEYKILDVKIIKEK